MKIKRLIALVVTISMLFCLSGCRTTIKPKGSTSVEDIWGKFTVIEERNNPEIGSLITAYENDTKVVYYIWFGGYRGGMCPAYDEDGNVMIYGGEDE